MQTSHIVLLVMTLLVPSPAFCAEEAEYQTSVFIPGSGLHGIHGLAFDGQGQLVVGSVIGQSIYRVDPETGATDVSIAPPLGMADDLEFSPNGRLVWTSFLLGKIHARRGDGPIKELATGLMGVNSLAFNQDGRLFATQVFLGDALFEIDLDGTQFCSRSKP